VAMRRGPQHVPASNRQTAQWSTSQSVGANKA
jgi:hypothetical protein